MRHALQWVSAVFLLIMSFFVDYNWLGLLFVIECVVQLLRAYSVENTLTDKLYLLNPNAYVFGPTLRFFYTFYHPFLSVNDAWSSFHSPKTTKALLFSLGLSMLTRWRLAGALIFTRGL
jgi:hypothetical protein